MINKTDPKVISASVAFAEIFTYCRNNDLNFKIKYTEVFNEFETTISDTFEGTKHYFKKNSLEIVAEALKEESK